MTDFNRFGTVPILLAVLFLNGCATYYLPNSHNVPLLREKNDARVSLTGTDYRKSNSLFTLEFQGSYAVSNKIGVVVNTMVGGIGGGSEF